MLELMPVWIICKFKKTKLCYNMRSKYVKFNSSCYQLTTNIHSAFLNSEGGEGRINIHCDISMYRVMQKLYHWPHGPQCSITSPTFIYFQNAFTIKFSINSLLKMPQHYTSLWHTWHNYWLSIANCMVFVCHPVFSTNCTGTEQFKILIFIAWNEIIYWKLRKDIWGKYGRVQENCQYTQRSMEQNNYQGSCPVQKATKLHNSENIDWRLHEQDWSRCCVSHLKEGQWQRRRQLFGPRTASIEDVPPLRPQIHSLQTAPTCTCPAFPQSHHLINTVTSPYSLPF